MFEGYTLGEEWNGFACPYFTFDESQRLASVWRERGREAEYDSEKAQFTFIMDDGEEQQYSAVNIENTALYPIGAFSWIWEESETSN